MDSGLAPRGAPRNDDGVFGDAFHHSRGTKCPSVALIVSLSIKRAQGAPDAHRTRGSHRTRNATGTPKHRHSLRNGLRLIRGLLGAPGFLATVACAKAQA